MATFTGPGAKRAQAKLDALKAVVINGKQVDFDKMNLTVYHYVEGGISIITSIQDYGAMVDVIKDNSDVLVQCELCTDSTGKELTQELTKFISGMAMIYAPQVVDYGDCDGCAANGSKIPGFVSSKEMASK